MKRFFTFLKTELKLSLRDMNMPIFAVIMPLAIFAILGVIYGAKPAFTVRIILCWNRHLARPVRLPSAPVV